MRIAHFITDEKFIDSMILAFDKVFPDNNSYYLISGKQNPSLAFLKSKKIVIVEKHNINTFLSCQLVADIVIIHNLNSLPYQYIQTIDKKIKVVWFSWGFDIYSNRLPQLKLVRIHNRIKRSSLPLNVYLKKITNGIIEYFCYHKSNLIHYRYSGEKLFKDAIHRIDFYSGVFPLEYDLVSSNNYFRAKQVLFTYPGNEGRYDIKDVYNLPTVGDDIQIGQSATPLLNHVSALKALHKANICGRKIIMPLSYQNEDWYVDYVCKVGKKLYGDYFVPLRSFMPLDKYSEIMKNVGVAIFYVMQQSAVGNIIMALWNGAKVFLPRESLNYKHFHGLGFVVFPIDNISQSMIEKKLTPNEIIVNRLKLTEFYSYKSCITKIENLIKSISDSEQYV